MAEYDFNKDIIVGEAGEDVIVKLLEKKGQTFISNNKDNRYDIIMDDEGAEVKYEIKTDVYCKPGDGRGNLFVEHECRGKDSGIMVTEADWYVTYFKHLNEVWMMKSNELREFCPTNPGITTRAMGGDKDSNTKGYLVPREMYRDRFIVEKI